MSQLTEVFTPADSMLFSAVAQKSLAGIKNAFKDGARPNVQDARQNTPLHFGVASESSAVVQELVNAGANPNITNDRNSTPFASAVKWGLVKIAQIFVTAGASVKAEDNGGQDLMLLAKTDEMKEIVSSGANNTGVRPTVEKLASKPGRTKRTRSGGRERK